MSSVLLWPILALIAGLWGTCADAQQVAPTTFSCDGRTSGYYADVSTGCQVYHMCDGLGRQFSYSCPSKTLFQQRMLICDHWYMVNCSKAEEDYSANLLIGQQGRAFVEDRQFHRTPRPDLGRPETTDVHIFKAQQIATKNLVGAEAPESATDREEYNPPSHWSLEKSQKRQESGTGLQGLVKQSFYKTNYGNKADGDGENKTVNFPSSFRATTPVYPEEVGIDMRKFQEFGSVASPPKEDVVKFPSKFQATTPVYPQHVAQDPSRTSEFDVPAEGADADVKFPSHFQATTPVYPKHVSLDPSKLSEFDFPPDDNSLPDQAPVNFASKFKATTPVYPKTVSLDLSKYSGSEETPPDRGGQGDVVVNFASNFQATTPVYPDHVDLDLSKFQEPVELPLDNSLVNFESSFQATTPVYPQKVAATSPDPSKVGLVAPQPEAASSFDSTFKRRSDEDEPSVLGSSFSGQQLTEFMLTIKPEQLKNLKQLWHIPDYEFPLEMASRPGYEAAASSFQERGKSR